MEKLNYAGKKAIILRLVQSPIVIRATQAILMCFFALDRVASHLKLRALVSDSSDCLAHWSIRIIKGENISIGSSVGIGRNVVLGAGALIRIGNGVRISDDVVIQTGGLDVSGDPPYREHKYEPIIIEDGVWLGVRSIVLGGVRIGENSIIGAGAVVTKNVPSNTIVVGARVRMFSEET